MNSRNQEMAESFALAEKQRFDMEKRLGKLIDERSGSVAADL